MSEHIVKLKDEQLGNVNLDVNSGYVYDQTGNQVAKWTPADNNDTQLIADHCADIGRGQMYAALKDVDPTRAMTMTNAFGGRLVNMDLGVGDVVIPAALPNYASGYSNAPPMADVAAPPLLVDKPSAKYYQFAKEDAFQRALPIIGAPGANVAEIAPRVANSTFSTVEYALGGFVSSEVQASADSALRIRQATAARIMMAQTIEREIRVATLIQTAANMDASQVVTLASGYQWDGGANSDPIADLQNRVLASWGESTAILMSEKIYFAFLRNPNVQKYFRAGSGLAAFPSLEQIRSQFGLPPIYVARMKYINSAGLLDYIWGNTVAMVRQPTQMPPTSQQDVATAYTFRWNGLQSSIPDATIREGYIVREYFVQDRGPGGGMKMVTILNDQEVITSKYVGGLVVGAYQ